VAESEQAGLIERTSPRCTLGVRFARKHAERTWSRLQLSAGVGVVGRKVCATTRWQEPGVALSSVVRLCGPDLDPEEDTARSLADLRTRLVGFDEREAERRLQQIGPNEIRRETGPRWRRSLVDQLIHPLALLPWAAAALSAATGVIALAAAIVVVIVLNAAFAFVQERQAGGRGFRVRGDAVHRQ
jgi:magnesium-transporting ATPase (P-type)